MEAIPSASWLARVTSFTPPKGIEDPPSWEDAVGFLALHGLAPIAGYNLQYQMPDADAPEGAKDMLLGYLQGIANDNVLKLMTLKSLTRALGEKGEPAKIVLMDGASFGDTLYTHIAFRAVPELRLLVRPEDVERLEVAMRAEQFVEMEADEPDPDKPAKVLFNDRFYAKLFAPFLPNPKEEPGIFARAIPARALGPEVYRPSAEDALLLHVLPMARRGFAVPLIQFVDLREMVKGDSPLARGAGPGAPIDREVLLARAKAFGVEKPLWAAMELLAHFHPEVADRARALEPDLGRATRALLETGVIEPAKDLSRERQLRGVGKLVQLLLS